MAMAIMLVALILGTGVSPFPREEAMQKEPRVIEHDGREVAAIREDPAETVWLVGAETGVVKYFVVQHSREGGREEVEVFRNTLSEAQPRMPNGFNEYVRHSPRLLRTLERAVRLKACLGNFAVANGGFPSETDYRQLELAGPQGESFAGVSKPVELVDGYNRPFEYRPGGEERILRTGIGSTLVHERFELRLLGPDGIRETSDDILLQSPEPAAEVGE